MSNDSHVALSVHFFSVLDVLPRARNEEDEDWDLSVPLGVNDDSGGTQTLDGSAEHDLDVSIEDFPVPTITCVAETETNLPLNVSPRILNPRNTLQEKDIEKFYQAQQRNPWKMPVLDKTQKNSPCLFVPFHDNGEEESDDENRRRASPLIENLLTVPNTRHTIVEQGSHRRLLSPSSGYASDGSFELKNSKSRDNSLYNSTPTCTPSWKVPTKTSQPRNRTHRRMFSMGDARTASSSKSTQNSNGPSQSPPLSRRRSERVLTRECSPIRVEHRERRSREKLKERQELRPCLTKTKSQASTSEIMRKVKLTRAKEIIGKASRATSIFNGIPFQSYEHTEGLQLSQSLVNTKMNDQPICADCQVFFSFTSRKVSKHYCHCNI